MYYIFVNRALIFFLRHLLIFIFIKESKEAKLVIPLARLNICLAPAKMNMDNCMQFTFIEEGVTKHIFVSHDKAEGLIDWYMGVRRCKLIALMRAYPSAPEAEVFFFAILSLF